MAAATSGAGHSRKDVFSGALLATGATTLFVGTLFYTRLTWRLGLPALPAERSLALADALTLGVQKLWLAGTCSFAGDCLLVAACIVLVRRRQPHASDLESAGWALLGVSMALATIFDSMMAVLFWPMAHDPSPSLFLAYKTWFDFLFGAAGVPFGLGGAAVLWADARSTSPLLPKLLSYFGIAVSGAAAVSGFGYTVGWYHLPLVIGFTVTLWCVVFAVLGVQIARSVTAQAAATEYAAATRG